MPFLPIIREKNFLPLLSILVLFLSIFIGVRLVQQQQELRTKAAGNTYYVATNGSDGNPGTINRPWRTIAKASAVLQPGDAVFIRGGTYKEPIKPARSGSSSKRITYSNYKNERAVVSGINDPLILSGRSYITIHGIEFRNVGRYLEMLNGHYNHIEYSIFTDSSNWKWRGMYIGDGSSHNWFHHNSISRHGDYIDGEDHSDIISLARGSDYNLFEDNKIFYGGHSPVLLSSSFNVFRNNYFHNEEWKKGYGNRHIVAQGPAGAGFNLIEGNRFGFSGIPNDSPFASGFQLALSDNVVRFNDFYENKGNGLDVSTYNVKVSNNNHIYNNVFYHNGIGLDPNEPVAMSNNVGLKFSSWATQIKNTVVKNNIFYRNVGGPIAFQGSIRREDQTIENNWESGDPLFVDDESPLDPFNPNLPDFRLQANSPAIDAGIHLTQTASSGSGTSLRVDDSGYFSDGFGIVDADWVKIGSGEPVQVREIDYAADTITLAEARTWNNNDPVWLYRDSRGNIVFQGSAPDLGAHEFGAGAEPTPTVRFTPTPTPTLAPGCYQGVASWQNFPLSSQTGTFSVEYDATPLDQNLNAIVALSTSAGSTFDDFATLVRFANGIIDVRNGSSYSADTNVSFTSGTKYHFKQDINITNDTYSVWVTPEGGSTKKLATDYAFRSTQSTITSIANWGIWADAGSSQVCNFTLSSTPSPTKPPPPTLPGDIDKDGDVDIFDYNLLIENFGSTNCGNVADINSDCKVDIFDYNILIENFGKKG